MSAKKRVGRPTKAAKPGQRVSLGLKVTAAIKEKLDRGARESGRTQSQEAELRIERSFTYEKMHADALQAEVEMRIRAEDQLAKVEDQKEELELKLLNIGQAIETGIANAFAKAGIVKPKGRTNGN